MPNVRMCKTQKL